MFNIVWQDRLTGKNKTDYQTYNSDQLAYRAAMAVMAEEKVNVYVNDQYGERIDCAKYYQ